MRKPALPRLNTIRSRLTAWYVLLLALTLLAFSAFVSLRLQRSLLDQSDEMLQTAAFDVRGMVVAPGLSAGDPLASAVGKAAFVRTLRGLHSHGVQVRLISTDGKVPDGLADFGEDFPPPSPLSPGYGVAPGADGEPIRIFTARIETRDPNSPDQGKLIGWVQTGRPISSWERSVLVLNAQMLLGIPLALCLAGAGGLFLASRALRPIDRITRTAQAINAKDLSRRIGYKGPPDEVGRLAETLDQMLDRIESGFERERRFTADASHELRTPLAAIKGRLEVALSRPRDAAEYQSTLSDVGREVDRLIQLSGELLLLARLDHGELRENVEPLDLSELLESMIESLQPLAQGRDVTLEGDVAPGLVVRGDLDQLTRLFLNPLDNALKFTPPGGRVSVRAARDGGSVAVSILDTGPGIAPEHLPHLFERFYRVETARTRSGVRAGGAGLGLAIASEIARRHGGQIDVKSELGKGMTLTVRLPNERTLTSPSPTS